MAVSEAYQGQYLEHILNSFENNSIRHLIRHLILFLL